MARLSTTYDSEVGKVFKLRGDERYAWTTDTILTVTETGTEALKGYTVSITGQVLRDIGASYLTLYDNDTVLEIKEIDDDDDVISFTNQILAWNQEHNLWLKYSGNRSCLGSKTKKQTLEKPLPAQYKTEITFTTAQQIDITTSSRAKNVAVSLTVDGVAVEELYNTDVAFYLDGTLVNTINTGSSTTATCSITFPTDKLYTVTAVVEDSDYLWGNEVSKEYSVNYDLKLLTVPTNYVSGHNNVFTGSIKDWFGSGVNKTVNLIVNGSSKTTGTSSNGDISITYTSSITSQSTNTVKLKIGTTYSNEMTMAITNVGVTGINLTVTPMDIIAPNYEYTLNAEIVGDNANLINTGNITFTNPSTQQETDVAISNGKASITYNNVDETNGNIYGEADYGDYSTSITLNPVEMYLHRGNPNYEYNKNISSTYAPIRAGSKYYYVSPYQFMTRVQFKHITQNNYSSELFFKILGDANPSSLTIKFINSSNAVQDTLTITDTSVLNFPVGTEIGLRKEGKVIEFRRNNILVAKKIDGSTSPYKDISFEFDGFKGSFVFNDVILKRGIR